MNHVSMYCTLYFSQLFELIYLNPLKWRWYHLMSHIILQHKKKVFQLSGKISSMLCNMTDDIAHVYLFCAGVWLKQSDVVTITKAAKYTLFPNHLSAERLYCIKPNQKQKERRFTNRALYKCLTHTELWSNQEQLWQNQKQWVNKAQWNWKMMFTRDLVALTFCLILFTLSIKTHWFGASY